MSEKKTFTIECSMDERWVNHFCSMLREMERNGNIGHSCFVGLYADGDGDFRPEFKMGIEYERVKPLSKPRFSEYNDVMYDAG